MQLIVNDGLTLEQTAGHFAAGLFPVLDRNRDRLNQFLPWVEAIHSEADLRDYLENCEKLFEAQKEVSFIMLWEGLPVGRIGLHHLNAPNRTAAIGYWVGTEGEGKGVVTAATRAIIRFGFEELNLNRIELKTAVHNVRSQAIAQRLGFTKEGIMREAEFVAGRYNDLYLYSLLKYDW